MARRSLALLAAGLAVMAFSSGAYQGSAYPDVPLVLLNAVGAFVLAAVAYRYPVRVSGSLTVGAAAVLWDGEPVIARASLVDAVAYTNLTRHGVRLRTRWRSTYFELASRHEADTLVELLGLDGRVAALEFAGEVGVLGAVAIQASFATMRLSFAHFGGFFLALLLVHALTRVRWVVGNDGLLVRRGLRPPCFIPYSEVSVVSSKGSMTRVGLSGGTEVRLGSHDDSRSAPRPVVGARALASRIEEARQRATRFEAATNVTALLSRGSRDVATWVRGLGGLDTSGTAYRSAAVSRAMLWCALEDVAQPADVRAAAATALRARLENPDRVRLRVAAAACASPKLRFALEAAEGEDDQRVAEALSGLGPNAVATG